MIMFATVDEARHYLSLDHELQGEWLAAKGFKSDTETIAKAASEAERMVGAG